MGTKTITNRGPIGPEASSERRPWRRSREEQAYRGSASCEQSRSLSRPQISANQLTGTATTPTMIASRPLAKASRRPAGTCAPASSRRRAAEAGTGPDRPRAWLAASLALAPSLLLVLGWLAPLGSLVGAVEASSAESGGEQPFVFEHSRKDQESEHWLEAGRLALEGALKYAPNTRRAKSAIIFIGDGMSLSTITAARILHGQLANRSGEEGQLSFEELSNVALIKTYNLDQQVPDSAATATAILAGVKTNFYTLGVNGNVKLNETDCGRIQRNQVHSIIKQAQEAGKATGIVTNTRITHATPAAAYAHASNRRWECDTYVPRSLAEPCKDIARQLIEDEPGSRLDVILGGGRRCFFGPKFIDPGPTGKPGMRLDNRNLINDWIAKRNELNDRNYAFVNSTQDLRLVNTDETDHLLGLFSYSHMSYEELRDTGAQGEPSLAEMTATAIKILAKNPLGFVLLVEGGRIDHAHHENVAGVALRETIALSWAVESARALVDQRDTLIAVTSDHAHALTINGIAPRGNPILGLSRYKENSTNLPYTTLIYGNGPGNRQPRPNPAREPNGTDSPYYVQYAAIHQDEAFHDGTDVALFAAGPFAHLFQGVQEQSYIAHVFAYALCIGQYSSRQAAHCREGQGLGGGAVGRSSGLGRVAGVGRAAGGQEGSLLRHSAAAASSPTLAWAAVLGSLAVSLAVSLGLGLRRGPSLDS